MRARGEIRQALRAAFDVMPSGRATWVQAAEVAQVGRAFARATVRNMARAGELVVVGQADGAGNRKLTVYAPSDDGDAIHDTRGLSALDSAVRAWHRR